jgi:hypothetical protein
MSSFYRRELKVTFQFKIKEVENLFKLEISYF